MIRLLKRSPNGGLELVTFNDDDDAPPYAILSHTWSTNQEIAYSELVSGTGKDKTGYNKIHFCVDRAAADKLEYSWVDTCCINKSADHELTTAINSMFRWYQRSTKCYVYLSDVRVPEEVVDPQAFRITWVEAFRQSRWFKRGWTLQELLAPPTVEFFSKEGKLLGSKVRLEQEVCEITKIPIAVLRGQDLSEISKEERKRWMVKRTTTVEEDRVYCLLGIFGVFLPLIYGEGEKYAALRLEDEIRKRQDGHNTERPQELTGKTGSLQPSSHSSSLLPFPRNEHFVGRKDYLQSLKQFLRSDEPRHMTIHGLGGCGKSALAIEFAYHVLAEARSLVFWVPAVSQETFELAYREIGIRLRIPGIADDKTDVKQLVKDKLESAAVDCWIMIIDNADDARVLLEDARGSRSARLFDYVPRRGRGKILYTTRTRKMAENLTPCNIMELSDMSHDNDEARQLLERRISKAALLSGRDAVTELLKELTYLPLAIVQAAAFMSSNDVSVSEYTSLFREAGAKKEIFGERFEDHSRYRSMDSTIAKTWYISFDQMRKQDVLAAEYLSFMACIDRINIPLSLLPQQGSLIQQLKAIGTLKGYAFITEREPASQQSGSEKYFDMHRLVHMTSTWWLEERHEQSAWADQAAKRLLTQLLPDENHEKTETLMAYLPHAIRIARPDGKLNEARRAELLCLVGQCQYSLGQFSRAETAYRQELLLNGLVYGEEHHETIRSLFNVGCALSNQRNHRGAESVFAEALSRCTKTCGPEHSSTLKLLRCLAYAYHKQARWEEAEQTGTQVVELHRRVLGFRHPETLSSISSLASTYSNQGRLKEAEELRTEVMRTGGEVLGADHPDVLVYTGDLACIYGEQGRWKEAEELMKQVLETSKTVFGANDMRNVRHLSSMARIYTGKCQWEEAEQLLTRVIEICSIRLGADHPMTLVGKARLATTYCDQDRWKEAEQLYARTLETSMTVLGAENALSLEYMTGLARVWKAQGKDAKAVELTEQCLELQAKTMGTSYPRTLRPTKTLLEWKTKERQY